VDIINDLVSDGEGDRRSIISQYLLLLESLILNNIIPQAFAKESPMLVSIVNIPSEHTRLDCLI